MIRKQAHIVSGREGTGIWDAIFMVVFVGIHQICDIRE